MLDFNKFRECIVDNNYASQFYEYNGKIYYCRKSITYYELIISSIAKYLGVECVEYLAVKKDNDLYLASENFMRDEEVFLDGYELLESYKEKHNLVDSNLIPGEKLNNLNDISIIFNENFSCNSSQLLQKLNEIFAFDILFGYCDRQSPNWGILQSSDNIRLAPMYDGKWSFSYLPPLLLITEEDRGKPIETIIEHFLNTANLSAIKTFMNYYEGFNVTDLQSMVLSISSNNNIDFNINKICTNFIKRREVITKVLTK